VRHPLNASEHAKETGNIGPDGPAHRQRSVLALAALLAASSALGACGKGGGSGPPARGGPGAPGARAQPVEVETLAATEVEEATEYVANLVSRRSVTIYPMVGGYVLSILVKPGETVKLGARLLRIDARQEAAALTQTRAALAQAETQAQLAAVTRQRMAALQKEGIRSRQDYENAAAEEEAARANVQAARANVRVRSVQLGYHDVTAPLAGVVGDIVVKVGDSVTPQTILTQIDESGRLEVSVGVPIERADQARVGETPIELLNEAGQTSLRAPLFFVAPRPDPRSQLIELRAAFENATGLRSGQRVRARVVWRVFSALTVPTFAVTRQSGQAFLFMVRPAPGGKGEVAERRPVTLGLISGDRWTVTAGAKAGERVAVSGLQALRDGQPVKPAAAARPGGGAGSAAAPGPAKGAI
jgi:RND family efflux transporter MFP subunit